MDQSAYWQTLQYYQYVNQMYYEQLRESFSQLNIDNSNEQPV